MSVKKLVKLVFVHDFSSQDVVDFQNHFGAQEAPQNAQYLGNLYFLALNGFPKW